MLNSCKDSPGNPVAHPVDIYVGRRLKMRRTMLGITQEFLGKAVGITFQQIQKYENGSNRIGCSRLFDISIVLKTPISFFFAGLEQDVAKLYGFTVNQETILNADDSIINKEIPALVKAYMSIQDPHIRKKIMALVRSLV
jgi:transcriptional regulator with XRE-family HTH domain